MEVNIALVGVSGVGKTALVSQLCHETFFISPYPTIEDRHQKEFNIRGQTFKVTILDTGGDPKNNFLHTKWYKWADAFIFVYSVTSRKTLEALVQLKEEITAVRGGSSLVAVLAGNCADENNEQGVQEGQKVSKLFGWPFFPVSAKTGQNVPLIFEETIKNFVAVKDMKAKSSDNLLKRASPATSMEIVNEEESLVVSAPYNLSHNIHVDVDFNWTGQDPLKIFELIEKLGQGAYGVVYKARHREANVILAIKIVEIDNAAARKEVQDEIDVLKKCRHNHIVNYYGAIAKDKHLWILMDYCESGSMKDLITTLNISLAEAQISLVLYQSLLGLAYLHAKRILHRDIKAANILMNSKGEVKIADFGVATTMEAVMGKTDTLVGTPYWMSPEICSKRQYSEKSDIWALGITAIELAERVPPMHGTHPLQAMMTIPKQDAPKLKNPERWSPDFTEFLQKCLSKDPSGRMMAVELLSHPFVLQGAKLNAQEELAPLLTEYQLVLRDKMRKLTISNSMPNDPGSKTLPSKALPANTKGQTNIKTINTSANDMNLVKTSQSMMYFNDSTSTFVDKSTAGTMASSTFVDKSNNNTMNKTMNSGTFVTNKTLNTGTFVDKNAASNTMNSGTFVDKSSSNTFNKTMNTGTFVDKSGTNTFSGTFVDKSGTSTINKAVPADKDDAAKKPKKPLPKIPLAKSSSSEYSTGSQTSPRRATFGENALAKSSPTIIKPKSTSDEFKPSPSSPSMAKSNAKLPYRK
jgi:small GTP-binding protein